MSKNFVVVPCYNETPRLNWDNFVSLVADTDLILVFVNDGSTDDTGAQLAGLCDRLGERGQIVEIEKNIGKGEAVRKGMLHALDQGAELVGYIDADMSTPASEIGRLLAIAVSGNYRAVMGARIKILGHSIERSAVRHILGRIFATFATTILRVPVYDTQCGAKIFRVDTSLREALTGKFHSRWAFDVELIGRLTRPSNVPSMLPWDGIVEIPLKHWADGKNSKLGFLGMIRTVFDLIIIWSSLRRLKMHKKS